MKEIKIKLTEEAKILSEDGISFIPIRANPTDAGLDLFSIENNIVLEQDSIIVPSGVCVEIPEGYVGLIWPRSGLSCKSDIETGAGVVDSGYQGEIKVHLYNFGTDSFKIKVGAKIAQLLIVPIVTPIPVLVGSFEEETSRGEKGFGSSDIISKETYLTQLNY